MRIKEWILGNKLIRSFIILLTGEGISSIFGLVSFTLTIKAIGLDQNGVILSIQTYTGFLYSLFGFKPFEGLIRYVSFALEEKNYLNVKNYIKQSYLIDISTAVITILAGFIAINYYAHFIKWDAWIIPYVRIYLLLYFVQIEGTSIGILRVFGKFNYITYRNIAVSIVRLVLVFIGFVIKAKFAYFLFVEAVIFISTNIIILVLALRTLKENNLIDFYKTKIKLDMEYLKFNIYNNLSSTIDLPVNQITTIFINKYLGYSDITVYKVFERLGSIISRLGGPLNQIIFPEMNLLIAQKNYKRAKNLSKKLILGFGGIGAAIVIGVLITYKLWLGIFIPNYQGFVFPLIMYFILIVFASGTVGIHSLFLALNHIRYNIPLLLIVNTCYLITLYFSIQRLGLSGVVLALLLQAVAIVCSKLVIMKSKDN